MASITSYTKATIVEKVNQLNSLLKQTGKDKPNLSSTQKTELNKNVANAKSSNTLNKLNADQVDAVGGALVTVHENFNDLLNPSSPVDGISAALNSLFVYF